MDWGDTLEVLVKVNPLYRPLYIIFVAFITYAFLGVLTAAIMDSIEDHLMSVDQELVIQRFEKDTEDAEKIEEDVAEGCIWYHQRQAAPHTQEAEKPCTAQNDWAGLASCIERIRKTGQR